MLSSEMRRGIFGEDGAYYSSCSHPFQAETETQHGGVPGKLARGGKLGSSRICGLGGERIPLTPPEQHNETLTLAPPAKKPSGPPNSRTGKEAGEGRCGEVWIPYLAAGEAPRGEA
jgi:hypothetical protein